MTPFRPEPWTRALSVLSTILLVSLAACGGDDRPPGRDGGGGVDSGGACTEGALVCRGQELHLCTMGGTVLQETCPPEQFCVHGLGCRMCPPGMVFCEGQEVRVCNEDGSGSTLSMECPASSACRGGACVDACAVARDERSNVGCDYFAVDLDNEYTGFIGDPPAQEQFAVVLANPSTVTVQATVMRSDGRPNAAAPTVVGTYFVEPNDLVRIDLPAREVDGSTPSVEGPGTFLSNQAYRITTNFPVVAYQFNPIIESASNDASLLLPVPALDQHYRIIGWPTANPIEPIEIGPGIPDHSYVTIVGTEPNTTVTVTFGGPIVAGGIQGGGDIAAASAGSTVEYTIGPYDVLNLESDDIPGDMTGTLVTSSAPVSVFSGGERGIAPLTRDAPAHPDGAPEDWCCTEHLEEQVFPTTSWGKGFVVTRSPVRSDHATWREPDIYRIMADKPGTVVTTNLPAPNDTFTLGSGQVHEFYADRSFVVNATEAISIMQLLVSQDWVRSWKPGHGGDPSMILFPPSEQYRDDYIFLVPDTFSSNYVVISAPDGTDIFLDGGDINADEFMRICAYESAGTVDGTHYTAVTCPVSGGTHRVTSTLPTGIMVYGYHNVGSYGYAGGSNLTRINPLI